MGLTSEQLPVPAQVIKIVHMTWLFNVPLVGRERAISANMFEEAKITKMVA